MTKQEEIRLGTAKKIAEGDEFEWEWIVKNKLTAEMFSKADSVLNYLHSQGVVIEKPFKVTEDGYEGVFMNYELLIEVKDV